MLMIQQSSYMENSLRQYQNVFKQLCILYNDGVKEQVFPSILIDGNYTVYQEEKYEGPQGTGSPK
jgi:hypothetical protein